MILHCYIRAIFSIFGWDSRIAAILVPRWLSWRYIERRSS